MTEKSDSVSVLETLRCAGKATARLVTKRRRKNPKGREGEENIGLLRSVQRSDVGEKRLDTKKQQQHQKKKKKKKRNDRWSSRYVDGEGGVLLKFFLPVSLTRSPTRSPSSVTSRSPPQDSHRVEERALSGCWSLLIPQYLITA
ncbi:hypothetical protein MRB53_025902 [Persea americana]|uniref:Uncharacterized protein n=1 Tax=Persea americana TaxID=3435 RepID=A0ACC2LGL2_PERAE|nr:hypothetical protein MRB53_025902 [Persea americana]